MRRDLDPSFTTGSWNTYSIVEYSGPDFITPYYINKTMRVFQKIFKLSVDVVPGPQLLFWTLTLEKQYEAPTTRSASQRKTPKKTSVQIYKFAISGDEGLLFCSRLLSVTMQRQFSQSLPCNSLKLLKLTDSDPVNLLKMYQQSNYKTPGLMKLQNEEYLASVMDQVHHCGLMMSNNLVEEAAAVTDNKVIKSLGSSNEKIPLVHRVHVSIENVPLTEGPELPDFRWSHIDAEIGGVSVFHLYKEIGALKLINNIPLWLEKMRRSGRTIAEARYV